ncbi:hypothetical protein USB125703_01070 [Pseudoclavibacter triregionum]|nr:hypothetical protein USB125703_01070 [Pseudoclavibacter triregionum]
MTITGRLVALLLLGLAPVVAFGRDAATAGWILLGWLAGCLLLACLDAALAASPRTLLVERGPVETIRLGQEAASLLSIEQLGRRTLRGIVRDAWEPSAGAPRMRAKVTLPPGERRVIDSTLRPTRRGTRRARFVAVRSLGPLGLAGRQVVLDAPGELRVLPPFESRRHLPSRLARLRELDGRTSLMVRGQGTEFDSLRDYVRGDDIRSIDWRATARRQDLVVRTWRPERDRRVIVVIDSGRAAAVRVADETRLDTSIEASLLLAALASRAGDRVEVLALDRLVRARVQAASGAQLLPRIVEAMADVEPELLETDWAAVPALVAGMTNRRALVVLLTAIDSAGQAEELLEAVPQLARKHLVVVANAIDPDVAASVRARTDVISTYRAAAAERALLDQERVRLALAQLGAEVVDGPPQELPPRLADRYLELKKAGRL